MHDLLQPVPSAMKFLWLLVQIPKRDHLLGFLANKYTYVFSSGNHPWSNQPGQGGAVMDRPFQGNVKWWVSRGIDRWRRYWYLFQRGLTIFAELLPTANVCIQLCVQPILYPIHVSHSLWRHLAQIRHSKFLRSPYIPCFQILPQVVPSLPERLSPTSPMPSISL